MHVYRYVLGCIQCTYMYLYIYMHMHIDTVYIYVYIYIYVCNSIFLYELSEPDLVYMT